MCLQKSLFCNHTSVVLEDLHPECQKQQVLLGPWKRQDH